MGLDSINLEAVYEVIYTKDDQLQRIDVDHTALVQVISEVMKTGFLIKVDLK